MKKIETHTIKPQISFFENEGTHLILESVNESLMDSKIQEMTDFMRNNSGKNKSDSEKDELYQSAQLLWKNYANILQEVKYNFHLNKNQFKFLTDLILTKLEYDVNTVFFAIELTEMLAKMKDMKFSNEKELLALEVNATEITYIYHLIAKHKVKGLTRDAYTFANILKRIGSISKVFNYYDTHGKNLSNDIQNWVASFEQGVNLENREETLQAQVSKPKKKKEEEVK